MLLCKRGDKSVAFILSQNLDFESLVSKLSHKWKELAGGVGDRAVFVSHPNHREGEVVVVDTQVTVFRISWTEKAELEPLVGGNQGLAVGEVLGWG